MLLALIGCVGEIHGGAEPGDGAPDHGFESSTDPSEPQRSEIDLPACPGERPHPLARDVTLRQVALYQSVAIPLFEDGRWLEERAAPVVAGKQAHLRVHVELGDSYAPRPLRAVLRLQTGSLTELLADERTVEEDSTDDLSDSTFNIAVDAALMTADAQLSVSIEEIACDAPAGSPTRARAPTRGSALLRAEALGNLRIVLVPITVGGREPTLDEAAIARITDAVQAFYPVAKVEVKRRDPIEGDAKFRGGRAWTTLLQHLCTVRKREAEPVPSDVHYVGVFLPGATRAAYCGARECTLGLANYLPDFKPSEQCGLVAFFDDVQSGESVAHELGHMHGLSHARCPGMNADAGFDESYPHRNGTTGGWGWDVRTRALMPPDLHDLMSYCPPYGISSYNYQKLAERVRAQQSSPLALTLRSDVIYREMLVHEDGEARWSDIPQAVPPGDARESASVLDASGQEIARFEVGVQRFSHADGALLTLPQPGPLWSTLVWGEVRVQLSDVLPP